MRKHRGAQAAVVLLLLLAPASSVAAQDRGGVRSETEERLRNKVDSSYLWNLIGLLGLVGLAGLHRGHDEDSYHPASFE
ncbi:WGxxGxxG family protein [Sphingomonas hankyongi]|uniref:Uncharacterized protein n=1 Tax=Sphingomonas hankyongi TaxID=2908209 RepID=A0ABT0S477_9SPHN|nr:WGxxGxxG family protein [Sphingomonas hankyongi]MCL6730674.1 hypothetical protein [Sphingomonas hankyongi]